jgi:hypothetical protein
MLETLRQHTPGHNQEQAMTLLSLLPTRFARKTSAARRTRRLAVEGLEDRRMCALPACSFDPATGILTIQGTDCDDRVSVGYDPATQRGQVTVGQGSGPQAKPDPAWPFKGVLKEVDFYGGAGNDTFVNNTSLPCFADGGTGNDTLTGGGASDILFGGLGDDRLYGRGGNDSLYGNQGTDYLEGDAGDDVLAGGRDGCLDECRGGTGHDFFFEYYRPNGTLEQEKLDDFNANEDSLVLLQTAGWWNTSGGQLHTIPGAGNSGAVNSHLPPDWQ